MGVTGKNHASGVKISMRRSKSSWICVALCFDHSWDLSASTCARLAIFFLGVAILLEYWLELAWCPKLSISWWKLLQCEDLGKKILDQLGCHLVANMVDFSMQNSPFTNKNKYNIKIYIYIYR